MTREEGRVRGIAEMQQIHRGAPPGNCAMGCPEHRSGDICTTCYRRPVLSDEHQKTAVTWKVDANGEPYDIRPVDDAKEGE
jgi:hypothetical protein